MRVNVKKAIAFFMSLIIFVSALSIGAYASSDVYSWYCKRTKDHTQPPLPNEFEFISSFGGYYIDVKNYSKGANNKVIYLTFDAGYENGNVEKTLNVLKKHNVSAAFFVLSNLIESEPDLIKRMFSEGHLVCNHTSSHRDMSKVCDMETFKRELQSLEELCKSVAGEEMAKYFRPPEGKFSEQTLKFAKELGYKTVFWSFAYADWDNNKQMSKDAAKAKILSNMHNGAVILLHPTSSTNAEILGEVIVELKSQGYTFGTLDDLVNNNICR